MMRFFPRFINSRFESCIFFLLYWLIAAYRVFSPRLFSLIRNYWLAFQLLHYSSFMLTPGTTVPIFFLTQHHSLFPSMLPSPVPFRQFAMCLLSSHPYASCTFLSFRHSPSCGWSRLSLVSGLSKQRSNSLEYHHNPMSCPPWKCRADVFPWVHDYGWSPSRKFFRRFVPLVV